MSALLRAWCSSALVWGVCVSSAAAPELGEVEIVGTGPTTLLVIPCASCRWRSFDEFAERNAALFTTVAVTLPGYGGTDSPNLPTFDSTPHWHEYAVSALERLLINQDLRDVVVVGHSFGASIALQLASRVPGRIAGLVNLDGTLAGPLSRASMSLDERITAATQVRRDYMEPLADPDEWQTFNTPSIERQDRRLLYHGWFMDTDRVAVEQYWWDNMLTDRNPLLRRLPMRVLDVQLYPPGAGPGSRERYDARVAALDLGPNYHLVHYEGVRHFLMEDAPELLDAILRAFVAGTDEYPTVEGLGPTPG